MNAKRMLLTNSHGRTAGNRIAACRRGSGIRIVAAGLALIALAQYSEAAPGKVTICHKADSVKFIQITVASRALPAHLAHGDCVVDDGVPCTVDRCDASLGCVHAPDDSLCDDGNACTDDVCDPSPVSAGCQYTDNLTCRGACCWFKGCLDDVSTDDCRDLLAGTYLGHDATCETRLAECPTGACCFDGSCADFETQGYHRSQAYCEPGGTYLGDGSTCGTADTTRRGACCWFKGCQDDVGEADCRCLMSGTYLGNDTTCATQLEACPTGACCFDGSCADFETQGYHRSQAYCEPSGVYLGDGTTCATTQCCISPGNTGCKDPSECCDDSGITTFNCEEGRCCNAIGGPCNANEHCCDANAGCDFSRDVCCIFPPDSGCTFDSDCCFLTCNSGKCCARLGGFCTGNSSYCCNANAICGSGNTCCIPQFRSGCTQDADCCSGLVCTGGSCLLISKP